LAMENFLLNEMDDIEIYLIVFDSFLF